MGRLFEEFAVGDIYVTPERVVTEQDILTFADLTEDHNPVHVDPEFAARSVFGGCIGHGPMMVGIAFGLLAKIDLLDGTIIALKAIKDWSFDVPVRAGDGVHVRAEVEDVRPSERSPERGTVALRINVINRDGVTVQTGLAIGMMMTRAHPQAPRRAGSRKPQSNDR